MKKNKDSEKVVNKLPEKMEQRRHTEKELRVMEEYNNWMIEKMVENIRGSRLTEEEIVKRVDVFCKDISYLEERKGAILERIRGSSNKRVKFAD